MERRSVEVPAGTRAVGGVPLLEVPGPLLGAPLPGPPVFGVPLPGAPLSGAPLSGVPVPPVPGAPVPGAPVFGVPLFVGLVPAVPLFEEPLSEVADGVSWERPGAVPLFVGLVPAVPLSEEPLFEALPPAAPPDDAVLGDASSA